MKKLLNIIGLSMVLLLNSCDMDKVPQGTIDKDKAFDSVESIEYLEKGGYARLRSVYSPAALIVPDIQADYVNAVQGFSNTYGPIYKWNFRQMEEEIDLVWQNCYIAIAHYNFVLDGIQNHKDKFTAAEIPRIELVRCRMLLMRAMAYSVLAERFCIDYDEATAKTQYSGVPLVVHEDPQDKPGRATLFDVYDRIEKDIKEAKSGLALQSGSADAIYLNIDCLKAFEAHVYLQMGKYKQAYDAAKDLIDNPAYALAKSYEEFSNVWTYDRGKEIIFKFAASKTELPSSYGGAFYYDQFNGANESKGQFAWYCDYVPTQSLINSFETDDYRGKAWMRKEGDFNKGNYCWAGQNMILPGYTIITKYSGNPDLRTSNLWNGVNAWKLFRLAEMYLIAAEAVLMDPTAGSVDATTLLNTLREHRGLANLPGAAGMQDLKNERFKELMLEGYRMTDLKRWGDNIERGVSQSAGIYAIDPITNTVKLIKEDYFSIAESRDLKVNIDDYRVLWPIPADEIYANQILAGQQNPGWEQ